MFKSLINLAEIIIIYILQSVSQDNLLDLDFFATTSLSIPMIGRTQAALPTITFNHGSSVHLAIH